MKAVIEFENVDVETGEVMRSQATALASMTEQGMKLTCPAMDTRHAVR